MALVKMNQYKNQLKVLFCSLLLHTFFCPQLQAQNKLDSLMLYNQNIGSNAWQISGNPVFLKDVNIPNFATIGVFGQKIAGNFKRPQEFKQQNLFGFGGTGISTVKNWKFFGEFSYGKHYRDSIKYANVARPYDGNPFITADAIGGNWRGDQLTAKLQIAFPKLKKWQTGLKLNYATEQSARDNDPKPLYRILDYQVQPTIAYAINQKNTLALTANYQSNYEHTETGFFSDQNPLLYSIRGYGEFNRGPVVSAERFTKGWGWQVGTDYLFKKENTTLLTGARIGTRTADVNDGIAKPIFIGGFDEKNAELYISLERKTKRNGYLAYLKGWFKDGTGFDPVFKGVNPAYYFSGLNGRFTWYKQQNAKNWFSINLYPAISYTNYFESIAKTNWTSVMLHNDASLALNYKASAKTILFAEILLGYHHNLEKDIVINRPSALSPILVQPDFVVNSTNYLKTAINLSATYTVGKTSYYLAGGINLRNTLNKPNAQQLGARNLFNTTINLIF